MHRRPLLIQNSWDPLHQVSSILFANIKNIALKIVSFSKITYNLYKLCVKSSTQYRDSQFFANFDITDKLIFKKKKKNIVY